MRKDDLSFALCKSDTAESKRHKFPGSGHLARSSEPGSFHLVNNILVRSITMLFKPSLHAEGQLHKVIVNLPLHCGSLVLTAYISANFWSETFRLLAMSVRASYKSTHLGNPILSHWVINEIREVTRGRSILCG